MKTTYLTTLFYCVLIFCCQAQQNLSPTNDVSINERGTRLILISAESAAAIRNNVIVGDKELLADQPNFWMLHNTNGKGALLPPYHCFDFELKTTNGISISKTEMGKQMSEPPQSLTDNKTGKLSSIWNGDYGRPYDFPALTSLFNFPSNEVYVFELRCWAWQNSKKQYVLSDPVRVKVIKQDTNSPFPAILPINSPAK